MSTAEKCDAIADYIDRALAENDLAMAGLGADSGELAALGEIRHLSLPDPPGTTRMDIIRQNLQGGRRIF